MKNTFDVAVVGATGAVGEVMLEILEEREFPLVTLYPLASGNSAGSRVSFRKKNLTVQELAGFDFSKVQIALFAVPHDVAAEYVPKAAASGCIVIDSSAHFRFEDDVPLVVPEVNPQALADYAKRKIIANPDSMTIQMLMALTPIYKAVGISRLNVATYQAVSGTGKAGIEELAKQTADLLNIRAIEPKIYPKQIAFNILAQVGDVGENGYSQEEMQLVREVQSVLNDDSIMVNPTAVRVPVFYGHAAAIHVETREKISLAEARNLVGAMPGLELMDGQSDDYPPVPTEAAGSDAVLVGRLREDISHPRGLDLWVVSDNVRKGAALNSVQIAEILVKDYL